MTAGAPLRLAVLGGGGHAAMVIEAAVAAGFQPAAVIDRDPALWGRGLLGVPVIGGDECLGDVAASGITHFILGLGTVGSGTIRRHLFAKGNDAGLAPLTIVHPSAVVSPSATLGVGTVVLPGAVVGARATVGDNVIINTRAVVEHDCRIGDHVHVASGACLCGGCRVGDEALVGAGATIRQLTSVGDGAMVALGAVVIDDIPAGATAMGIPARLRTSQCPGRS